jgi:hypothetical protein
MIFSVLNHPSHWNKFQLRIGCKLINWSRLKNATISSKLDSAVCLLEFDEMMQVESFSFKQLNPILMYFEYKS